MTHLTKSSLFHKKSKGSFCKPHSPEEQTHVRKWSSSSTISHASEDDSHRRRPDRFNPLSLHPPLSFNTSPHMPQYDIARYQEDEERESRFFDQTRYADDHIQDMTEYSPIKGKNCYFEGSTARPYQYDQDSQWPLKDWQTIPPGLSEPSSSNSSSLASSPTQPDVPRRRNADWMDDTDVFIKRGAWKRQGIVFHLSEQDEQFQHQHFELPE